MVLRARGEQDLRGVIDRQVPPQGSEDRPGPGDGEGLAGPGHGARQVGGAARLQRLLDTDVGGLCQLWRGETRKLDLRGDPAVRL